MSLEARVQVSANRDILHPGVFLRPGAAHTLGQTETPQAVAEKTQNLNRQERIIREFFSLETPETITTTTVVTDGSRDERVAGAIPFSPRAGESLIIAAGDVARTETGTDLIVPQLITDLDPRTQGVYWDTLLGTTRALTARRDKLGEDPAVCRPVITMNSCPTYSKYDPAHPAHLRLPQSIGIPHAFASLHRDSDLAPFYYGERENTETRSKHNQYRRIDRAQEAGYSKEQLFLMRNPAREQMTAQLAGQFAQATEDFDLPFNVDVHYRSKKPPYGYELQITKTDGLRLSGSELATVMALHQSFYGGAFGLMEQHFPDTLRDKLRIQPSMMLHMTLGGHEDPSSEDPYNLRVAVRPLLFSAAGPLEAAGQTTELTGQALTPDEKRAVQNENIQFARSVFSDVLYGDLMEETTADRMQSLQGTLVK